jgi:hypothetical protein
MNGKTIQSYFLSALFLTHVVVILLVTGCIQPTTFSKTSTSVSTAPTTLITTAAPPVLTASPVPTPATSFNQYSNSKYGFSIDYPSDWQKNEIDKPEPEISLHRYSVVEFYSPSFVRCNSEGKDCVNVRSEVKIEVDTDPVSTELETFFVKDVARITSGGNVEITMRNAMFKLSGAKAYRLDYNFRSDPEDIKVLSAYTILNGKGYIITFHAHAPVRSEKINQYMQYYNDVMHMFESFKTTAGNNKTI